MIATPCLNPKPHQISRHFCRDLILGSVWGFGQCKTRAVRRLRNLTLDDAQVVMLGNETAEEPESGGALHGLGSIETQAVKHAGRIRMARKSNPYI